MPDVYNINGCFLDRENAVVPVEDRGYMFGDGVYEVMRAYGKRIFRFDDHMTRLAQSLDAIGIPFKTATELKETVYEALLRSRYDDALIYVQITRGTAKRSHVPPAGMKPTVVTIVYETPVLPDTLFTEGAKVILHPDIRWAKCYIKTLQLLPNTMALTRAKAESAVEAILHKNGIVTECGSSNVFIVKDNTVKTHPKTDAILHGVTRKAVIDLLSEKNINMVEDEFTVDELFDADEVFLTNTLYEILPVATIDDKPIADRRPGPITLMLRDEFRRLTKA